jgi:hypothetical protein
MLVRTLNPLKSYLKVLRNSLPAFQARSYEVGVASSFCQSFSSSILSPNRNHNRHFYSQSHPHLSNIATITLTSSAILKKLASYALSRRILQTGNTARKPELSQPLSLRRLRLIVHPFLSHHKTRGLTLHMNAFCAATITTTVTAIANCCKFQSD